jgi:Flp pilus assembly CpaE family ATPase
MGMIAPHLDIEPEHTITDLLRDVKRVDTLMAQKVLIKVADKFEILAGPNRLTTPTKALAQDVARVVDTLKQITDIVVLDVPCNYDDIYFETLAAAGQTILVGEQKLPSIRALKMVHEAINRPSGSEHVAINRYDPKNKGFVVERILNPLGVSSVHTVARDDLGMNDSVNLACVLRLAAPSSPALADILVLADHVLDVAPQPKVKKSPGLFSRLGRALVNT